MDTVGHYGYGEPALAIKAYMLDIPTHCRSDAHFQHKFRIQRPYEMCGADYWFNFVHCNRILFGEEIFQRVFLPTAKDICGRNGALNRVLAEDVTAQRDQWLARKPKHTPEEALAWLGFA